MLDDRSQTPEHRYEELSGLAETIEQRLPAAWRREIDEFFARGMIAAAHAGPAVLAHNDLLAEHVLIDSGSPPWRVCGVIDWGDVALADPAVDFVGLHCWAGAAFVREVRRHYRGPCDMNDAAPRIAFIAQCWALNDLAHVGVPRGRYSLQRALHHVAMAFGSGEMNS